jgi:hypothetical protein
MAPNQYTVKRKTNAHLSVGQRKIMMTFIKAHPTATWNDYMADAGKKAPCSDAFYYSKRREEHGPSRSNGEKRSYHRSNSTIYNTVWSHPVDKIDGTKPVNLLISFIEALNGMKRARFQVIELKQPAVIEVRESHR